MEVATTVTEVKGARGVLARFSFKNSRRGALFFGLGAAFMVWIQGLAYAASYSTLQARAGFAAALASNPAVGILYGESRQLDTTAGYMVYRTLPFLGFIGALWALAAVTRLLRGQEEDGRLELLLVGSDTLFGSLFKIIRGFMYSLGSAFVLCAALLVILGRFNTVQVSAGASLFFAAAIFAPAVVFAAAGMLTSQLAATRRRAMIYGVVVMIGLFILRSVGNVVASLSWLKYFTPFGWADKLHPVTGSDWMWFLPFIALTVVLVLFAAYYVHNRDYNESIVADNDTAKPRYKLLSGPLGLSFRLLRGSLLGWLLATVYTSALVAAIAKTAVGAIGDSPALAKALGNITGSNALVLAMLSFGGFFIALLMMVVAATGVGRLREDEAKGYLDNFLVSSVSRSRLVMERAFLLVSAMLVIDIVSSLAVWAVAIQQRIDVSAYSLIVGSLNFMGPAIMVLGVGILIYGVKPRLASYALYAWITWSFIVEMIASVVTISHYALSTSLLRQISMVPGAAVNWRTFAITSAIGIISFLAGLALFNRRDLVTE
jgi:ABC-2 type transport system permease protein